MILEQMIMLVASVLIGAIWTLRRGPKLLAILAVLWLIAGGAWLLLPGLGVIPAAVAADFAAKLIETGFALAAFALGCAAGAYLRRFGVFNDHRARSE